MLNPFMRPLANRAETRQGVRPRDMKTRILRVISGELRVKKIPFFPKKKGIFLNFNRKKCYFRLCFRRFNKAKAGFRANENLGWSRGGLAEAGKPGISGKTGETRETRKTRKTQEIRETWRTWRILGD